jgi:hypothetical protein
MKQFVSTLGLAAFLIGVAGSPANSQSVQKIANSDGRTVIDSEITLGADFPPITSKLFTSTPVLPLKKGTVLPAKAVIAALGMNQMWSVSQHGFAIGAATLKYPVTGLVRCSNFPNTGSFARVIASTTVIKVDLKTGGGLHSDGYWIEAKRAIKAGETIPTLRIVIGRNSYIVSIEEAPPATNKDAAGNPLPGLTIVREHGPPGDRDVALEAWRIANQSVRGGIISGLP